MVHTTKANNPLDISEIRSNVGAFLAFEDIRRCLEVCRSWRDTFLLLFWKTIEYRSRKIKQGPKHSSEMAQYNDLVRNLSIYSPDFQDYVQLYPNLDSLVIELMGVTMQSCPDLYSSIVRLVSLNTTVTKLKIQLKFVDGKINSDLWAAISLLPNLSELKLKEVDLSSRDNIQSFLQISEKLTSLDIDLLKCTGDLEFLDTMGFPNVRTLNIAEIHGPPNCPRLNIYRRCPKLRTLTWIYDVNKPFLECFETRNWPNLKDLNLLKCSSDTDLDTILSFSTPLEKITVRYCSIGSKLFESLRTHFDTLVSLSIHTWSKPNSYVPADILSYAYNLKALDCGRMRARDVVDSDPWVCKNLRSIWATVIFQEDEQDLQPLVFERISTLVQLRVLNIHDPYRLQFQQTLDLRLESGLGKLDTLTRLVSINFDGTTQRMNVAEIEWISRSWGNITAIKGRLNDSGVVYPALKKAVLSSNVGRVNKISWVDFQLA